MKIFDYQMAAAQRMERDRQLALLMKPGMGKTLTTLYALWRQQRWPALVVAPAQVVETNVWGKEAARWIEGMEVTPLLGTSKQRLKLLSSDPVPHVEVISYENLVWLTTQVDISKRYAAIVFDELSKMKRPGSARFRRLRAKSWGIQTRYGLTGTPVGNHLLDLWGEMFMVAGAKPLGPTFTAYRDAYFEPVDFHKRVWKLKCCSRCADGNQYKKRCHGNWVHCECHKKTIAEITDRIRPYAHTVRLAPEQNRTPPVHFIRREVPEPAALTKLTDELWSGWVATLPSGAELEAIGASAAAGKCRQAAGGAVYSMAPEGSVPDDPITVEVVHTAKLEALDDLLDELQGAPALVFYWYQHEKERILARLKGRAVAVAGAKGAYEAWDRGEVEVLLAHPQSAGFGLNLQRGGSTVIWFTLPHSHEMFTQGNARLARTGQKDPFVSAFALLCGQSDRDVAMWLGLKSETELMVMEGV